MKRPTRRRIVIVTLVLVGAVIAAGAAGIWWLTATEAGARRALAFLAGRFDGRLSVERMSGTLRGPLVLEGVRFRSESLDADVGRLRLEWRLRALLRRQVDVELLAVNAVRVRTRPSASEEPAASLPDLHLPVNVIVREARIDDVRFERPSPAPPIVVDSVRLSTSDIAGTVRIRELEVRGPGISGSVTGTLQPAGDYPLDLQLAWSYAPKDGDADMLAGSGRLSGSLEDLRIVHDLSSPAPVHLEAAIAKPMRDPSFDATATFSRISTRDLVANAPPAVVSGRFHASGTPSRLRARAELDADVRTADLGRVRANLDVERDGETWTLAPSEIALAGTSARLRAQGKARLGGDAPVFDAALAWTSVPYPLRGRSSFRSESGKATIRGTAKAYALAVDAALGGEKIPAGRWRLEGSGDRSGLALETLAGEVLGGAVRGSGRVAWSPSISWDLALSGEGIDPAAVAPEYAGHLAFDARTRGRMTDDGPEGRVDLARLDGTLRGRPVGAEAAVSLERRVYRIEKARLDVAGARVEGSGLAGERFDLDWTLEAPDLSALVAGSGGALKASGEVSGARSQPRIVVKASGERLAWGDRRAATLQLAADLALGDQGPMRLDLEASDVVALAGREAVDRLTAQVRGTRASHTLRLDASDDKGRLALAFAAAGALEGRGWTGTVRTLDFRTPQSGSWSLASAVPVSYSEQLVSVRDFCWVSGSARLCAGGERRADGGFDVDATVRQVPFDLFSPLLAPGVSITGVIGGDISAKAGSGAGLELTAALTAPGGRLQWGDTGDQSAEYGETRIEARTRGAVLEASVKIPLPGIGDFDASATLPRFAENLPTERQPLEGRIRAEIASLEPLAVFLPAAENVGGRLTADWTVGGTVGDPRLSGALRLTDGRATLLATATQLHDVQLAMTGDGSGPLAVQGSARAREGQIQIAGRIPMRPTAEAPVEISITGREFMALDTFERRVALTPDLKLTFDGKTLSAAGDLRVPTARVEYLSRLATVPASADVVVIGREGQEEGGTARASRFAVEARVRLILGQQVRVRAMGFEGRVRGSLLLDDHPGRPPTGTGELVVDEGIYKAYGAELEIERGRLRFAGPLDNPGLDLKAFRKADDGTVAGVVVTGTLRKPTVNVYSEPPMSQTDALAYLVLGHPLDQATPAEGSLVSRAATSAGIAGANLLGRQAAQQFGLETLRIESEAGQLEDASLIVGKYLSPRVYLEYGIGLLDQASQLRMNYILNKRWTVRAETGESNGGDIFYTFEH